VRKEPKKQKFGFTLIEILVSFGVVLIFAGIFFPRCGALNNKSRLVNSAYAVMQNARKVQEMALSAAAFGSPLPEPRNSYGLFFDKNNPNVYILYAETSPPSNNKYDANPDGSPIDFLIETVELPANIYIKDIMCGQSAEGNPNIPVSNLSVEFDPPSPETFLSSASPSYVCKNTAVILGASNSDSEQKIIINKAGLIYVED